MPGTDSAHPRDEDLGRIRLLIAGRAVLFSFLILTLIYVQYRYQMFAIRTGYLYVFLAVIFALSAVYWYLQENLKDIPLLVYIQISVDILLITLLVHVTGGIDSGLSILYHLTIISASIVLYRRGAILSASLASILYGAMLDMQFYGVAGLVKSENYSAIQVLYRVFINIVSFYAVAFLSSHLADRLRRTRQELQEKSIDFEDLRSLQEHILKSVGSGILTMDLAGRVTSWNPAAEFITGYDIDEIRERAQDVFGQSIRSLFGHTAEMMGRSYRFDTEIRKKTGATAKIGMTASLLKDEQERVRGIILVFQDITQLIEMEDRVRRQERLATVGSLAAGIAHEIRNPLASLSGSIQVLQKEMDLHGDNQRLMSIVLRETDRLNNIITEFLEYARPKQLKRELMPLFALVEETVILVTNSRFCGEGISIDVAVDRDIEVFADAELLRQVFWNLLLNACQSMPGGGRIMVSADAETDADAGEAWCVIIVSDTGEGIPDEHRKKLFDPFFTTKPNGTGLGLAIVYRIIEDHGGMIDVISSRGAGTKVRIRLPQRERTAYAAAEFPLQK